VRSLTQVRDKAASPINELLKKILRTRDAAPVLGNVHIISSASLSIDLYN